MSPYFITLKNMDNLTIEWHKDKLLEAIKNVDESYLRYAYLDYPEGEIGDEERNKAISHAERVFAYELYRQWANLLEPYKTGVVVNGEMRKDFVGDAIKVYNTLIGSKKTNYEEASFYPDLILHNGSCNMIACEIKRYENINGVIDDIIKLGLFLTDQPIPKNNNIRWTPFKIGVILLIGPEKIIKSGNKRNDEDIDLLQALKDELDDSISEDIKSKPIYCITYNGKNKEDIKSYTLKELLN